MLALVFAAICLTGLFWTALTLAIFYFDTNRPKFGTPWRLLFGAAGLVGVGAGGLVGALAGLDDFGISMATLVGVAVVLPILYLVVLPWLRRRQEDAASAESRRPPG
jgi:hypothetical protein